MPPGQGRPFRLGVIGQGEGKTASSQAGTRTGPALKRFGSVNGSAQRNATTLGKLASAETRPGCGARDALIRGPLRP